MKSKKISLNKLFFNNRFVLAFSVVAAVLVWLAGALQLSPEDERVIENVPVSIELSEAMQEFGLKAFNSTDYSVDVTVKGKRYLVSPKALGAEDLVVKANTKYVDSAGRYNLTLVPSAANNNADFEIVGISMENVEVYFDVEKTAEFSVQTDLNAPNGIVPDGYYASTPVLSEKKVRITGPETEVNRITEVVCSLTVDTPLTQTQVFDCAVTAVNAAGNEPDYLQYNIEGNAVTLTLPVYKLEKMQTGISFINSPADFLDTPFRYSITPSEATFAVAESKIESMGGIFNILTVDYSQLTAGDNTFVVENVPAETGVLVDKNVKSFTVNIYVDNMTEKTFSIPLSEIQFTGVDSLEPVTAADATVKVTVVAPATVIRSVTSDLIALKCDLSGYTAGEGTVNVPLSAALEMDNGWIYGDYSVNVTI